MTGWSWVLVIIVGLLNIVFNVQAQRAAADGVSWLSGLVGAQFWLTCAIGTISMILLYTLYRQEVLLARGLLLMGAVSILGGTILGVVVLKNRLDFVEWGLVGAIALLLFYRLLKPLLDASAD
jgi:hypothetical protein